MLKVGDEYVACFVTGDSFSNPGRLVLTATVAVEALDAGGALLRLRDEANALSLREAAYEVRIPGTFIAGQMTAKLTGSVRIEWFVHPKACGNCGRDGGELMVNGQGGDSFYACAVCQACETCGGAGWYYDDCGRCSVGCEECAERQRHQRL